MWLINRKRDYLVVFCSRDNNKTAVGNMHCTIKGKIKQSTLEEIKNSLEKYFNIKNVIIINIINLDKI